MASDGDGDAPPTTNQQKQQDTKRHRSIFDLPVDFFDSCRILPSPTSSSLPFTEPFQSLSLNDVVDEPKNEDEIVNIDMQRWSCNTCKAEFDSLQDQRSHFKSDIHRFNVALFDSQRQQQRDHERRWGASSSQTGHPSSDTDETLSLLLQEMRNMNTVMTDRLDRFETLMDDMLDRIETRMDDMLDRIEARMDGFSGTVTNISSQVTEVQDHLNEMDDKMTNMWDSIQRYMPHPPP